MWMVFVFGLLLSFINGKPAGLMEFIPPIERKTFYGMQQGISENHEFTFIEPIKCCVKYRNLTKAGLLRIPSFVEWK